MNAFRTYVNTKAELKIIEIRLTSLENKAEELAAKYLGIRMAPLFSETYQHYPTNESTVIAFIYEYEDKKQKNGLSIKEEINLLKTEQKRLRESLARMEKALREMEGIEYQLFYLIKVEGKRPKRAVNLVTESSRMSEATIWRYYAKMKESLK